MPEQLKEFYTQAQQLHLLSGFSGVVFGATVLYCIYEVTAYFKKKYALPHDIHEVAFRELAERFRKNIELYLGPHKPQATVAPVVPRPSTVRLVGHSHNNCGGGTVTVTAPQKEDATTSAYQSLSQETVDELLRTAKSTLAACRRMKRTKNDPGVAAFCANLCRLQAVLSVWDRNWSRTNDLVKELRARIH